MNHFLKFLAVLFVALNLTGVNLTPTNCDSFNCKKCLELVYEQNPNSDAEETLKFCSKNGDQISQELDVTNYYNVKLYVYNFTEVLRENFGDNEANDTNGIHKSLVVYNKEWNLLPSVGIIQNDLSEQTLGQPEVILGLGITKVKEEEFVKYLESLNFSEFKDEKFEEHLNSIISYLLPSN